jgi:hypothetical protein
VDAVLENDERLDGLEVDFSDEVLELDEPLKSFVSEGIVFDVGVRFRMKYEKVDGSSRLN